MTPILDVFPAPPPPSNVASPDERGPLVICTIAPTDGAGIPSPMACRFCGHAMGPGHGQLREPKR